MKRRSILVIAMSVAFVFVFTVSAYATFFAPTRARTWNWMVDYYTWGSPIGSGVSSPGVNPTLAQTGANPQNLGVHDNYLANTAKCGVCHSVHRARGDGIMLLNTNVPTCAGCHVVGTTVTARHVNWGAGPHSGGNVDACQARACHLDNPHGANGSQFQIVAEALLNPATDALLTTTNAGPLTNSAASGISVDNLNSTALSTWPRSTESLVRTGYNCNICHASTQLAVVNRGWSEMRQTNIQTTTLIPKQGHIGVAGTTIDIEVWPQGAGPGITHTETVQTAFAPVSDCESCHDQTDTRTSSGFTFPHGQTVSTDQAGVVPAATTSNMPVGTRALLWMGWSGGQGQTLTPITTNDMKAYDGNCLKCHRDNAGAAGVGMTY